MKTIQGYLLLPAFLNNYMPSFSILYISRKCYNESTQGVIWEAGKHDAPISPVVLTYEEFTKDIEYNTAFYQEVPRDGVTI